MYTELQKIFGDKLQLYDDLYQNMLDTDKKNTLIFLLESIKELYNMNKALQSKNDNYKELIAAKDKQIKDFKNEIKELKKDITKLNKIIKTNIQMNRKLSQNLDADYVTCNQLDDIFTRNLFYENDPNNAYYYDAACYDFDRAHKGYIGAYDFNISGNINDRVYLGMTVGLEDVHYKHISDYTEEMVVPNNINLNSLNVYDDRRITGTGYNLKFGAIFRPVEYAPFLIGVNVHTPTWYRLTTSNYTEVSDGNNTIWSEDAYDYKVYTPWKFGINMGYTDGRLFAIGASYDFADYAHTDTRINDGGSYDFYDYYESSSSDKEMNGHTKRTLKGVSTFKLGAEVRPIPEMAIRAGYNYVSAMYDKEGFKDGTLNSPGSYYATATDYTNWKATNRFTFGIGWRINKWNLDLAYQYSTFEGEFAPFMNYVDSEYEDWDNLTNMVKVDNKRHQILCSVGYTF